jgi:hypothetical protein
LKETPIPDDRHTDEVYDAITGMADAKYGKPKNQI